MDLNLAPEIPKGNSAKRKLLRKCLTYLASGGNDGGEAHGINVVANAIDRSLKIEKDSYLPRAGSSFSVDKWPGYDGLGHQVKAILRDELGADTPSKVTAGGHHEVDLIANSGLATAVIECKSGGAHSDNAQFSSYVELLLSESNTLAEHWFALC